MKKLFIFITVLLLMMSGALLLCVIVKSDPDMANGITAARVCWFHTSVFCLACSVLLMELTVGRSLYTFSLPDGLLLFLFGVVLFTYDKEANLQPERLLFLGQLTLLWFLLRSVFQTYPDLKLFYLLIITGSGVVVAVWSIFHFYGENVSVHPLFREIDYSFRPGPVCGYLAVALPVCLNLVLRFQDCSKRMWWEPRTGLYFWGWLSLLVILFALAGGMNRSAWIAAVLSCSWVVWMRRIGWEKTKYKIRRYRIAFLFSSVSLVVFLIGLPQFGEKWGVDFCKGRLLVWNVTAKAILEHPFTGTGLGSYPTVYAHTREVYFASSHISSAEMVSSSGYPDFPFNDYLHIGVELGIAGLLSFLLWFVFSLYYGIKHHQTGSCGGLLALGILALYSYPLQLPSFWVLLIFFSAICTTGSRVYPEYPQKSYPYIGALAAVFACLLFFCQADMPETYREWRKLERLAERGNKSMLVTGYRELYPRLCHNADFLKQGAACLSEAGEYSQAVMWLERAMLLSADRELFYRMAFNKRKLGKFREAERYLRMIHAVNPDVNRK